ncbi:hypothetical protein ABDK00_001505 [Niabella insulamsoli]
MNKRKNRRQSVELREWSFSEGLIRIAIALVAIYQLFKLFYK